MRKILVPIDFSECSTEALKYATYFAKHDHAILYMIHVLDFPHAYDNTSYGGDIFASAEETTEDVPFMHLVMKSVKAKMLDLQEQEFLSEVRVFDNIEVGNVTERIISAAKRYDVDMIIMGTNGIEPYSSRFAGSNSEKVVRNADRPVLTVRASNNKVDVKNIVFATDLSDEAELVLPYINQLAKKYDARIHLLKVITPISFEDSGSNLKKAKALTAKYDNIDVELYNAYYKEDGIKNYAKEINADMIALGTHGRHGISRLIFNSISEEVVNTSAIPILTLNFQKVPLMERNVENAEELKTG